MFKLIDDSAPDVTAIEAIDKVTHEVYRDVLSLRAKAMIAKGSTRMLNVNGKDLTGFELDAMADDGVFGLKHWHDFSHIAVVSDHALLNATVNMFRPFFHGQVRLFRLAELPAAKNWITSAS